MDKDYETEANDQLQRSFGAQDQGLEKLAALHAAAAQTYAILHLAESPDDRD